LQFPHVSAPFSLQVDILGIQLAQTGKRTEGEFITAAANQESFEVSVN
jgi:hypothetical protein